MKAPTQAAQITRASKSNLALAFVALPKERREDISVFYAFCRVVDDIADEASRLVTERQQALDLWKKALTGPISEEPEMAAAVRGLIAKYRLPIEHFLEIIAGVEMDLLGAEYATWEDLRLYCHRVASVVGLVSIEIFGCRDPRCQEYARSLGLALQVTNIIRDVGEDYANGRRIYLPREDLARFGYTQEDLAAHRHDHRFLALMQFEAERAIQFYQEARHLLPPAERRNLVAAEIMGTVYRRLLTRMQRDGFQVFDRRYRLSKMQKTWLIAKTLLRSRMS